MLALGSRYGRPDKLETKYYRNGVQTGSSGEHLRSAAHDIALRQRRGEASTEDLRKAMVHYRSLFDELLEAPLPERKGYEHERAIEER